MTMGQGNRILRSGFALLVVLGLVGAGWAQKAHPAVKVLKIGSETKSRLNHLSDYPNLESLTINCLEELKALPESLGGLTKLRELDLNEGNGCSMNAALPESIGNLKALTKLDLYGAVDTDPGDGQKPKRVRAAFPASMSQLVNLTYLDLGRNGLTQLPEFVGSLTKLRELHLNFSDLKDLPAFLEKLTALRVVTLGNDCEITQSAKTKASLRKRFPLVKFDFEDEYDCPAGK